MPNFQKYTSVSLNNPDDTSEHNFPLTVTGDNRNCPEERICVACDDHTIYMSEEVTYRLCEILLSTLRYIEDEDEPNTLLS